ncbi:class I SAM-dependent DNA methyltransferase [Pseudomonas sp. K1(2024)]|uniref:site-specific DNA-methyltransferase (adenine-specific) n=1 Tax=Pseudomonas boreofloridensis TaxID=3064348 RepID=A0ABV4ZEE0_9PSED|nr:N-6 DNA methylase [Pseudomonas sp. K13]MDO7904600.1 N-6 DNA methylase [Pseudomonas sp. K13]
MSRKSEFSSYVFIKNDLSRMGWNTKNPIRAAGGELYTQQECLDHPGVAEVLGRQRPEYVLKIFEDSLWVIEAKGQQNQIDTAYLEAVDYARQINNSSLVKARIVCGVAGNDEEGYLVRTGFVKQDGTIDQVVYNDKFITGLLSPVQARYLVESNSNVLNELVTDEVVLMSIAEQINEELHKASINKDLRATVMSSVLLAMVSDTLPNFNASPEVFIKDINNRAEDVLINHAKRQFAEYIEIRLPQESAARSKYKAAVVKVFFLLRKINIKAAMDGSQDLLGKFYEVFLKYGNGAKDIGIVLTPRHITEFSAKVLKITSSDLVYDPACGTGGFLVAAYDAVRNNEPENVEMFKKHRIFGVEQQANVASLAIVNMIFRGDGKNNIVNGDCLSLNLNRKIRNGEVSAEYQEDAGDRKAVTKVLMNPPFALKREDEQEFTFIDHALEQMVDGGLLLCVIPVSVMYSSGKEMAWRKKLLQQNTLVASMSFPNDLFYPQASVEPVIIVVRKGEPHRESAKCLFVRVTDDGFYKLKKRRLPHADISQLEVLTPDIVKFVDGGRIDEVPGVIQAKAINLQDSALELIPQQYLDNANLDVNSLKSELGSIQTELVFQEIRKGLDL